MNLYLFTEQLIKTAEEEDKKSLLNIGEMGIGASLLAHPSTKKNITGRETFYHGTAPQYAEKIKQEGIIPSKVRGSTDILEALNPETANASRNMAFVTPDKTMARHYAVKSRDVSQRLNNLAVEKGRAVTPLESTREHLNWQNVEALDPKVQMDIANPFNNKGIVEMSMPTWKEEIASKIRQNPETAMGFDKFHANIKAQAPVTPPKFVLKNIYNQLDAAKGVEGGVGTEFIKGSPNYKRLGLKELGSYIKNKPKPFAKGVGAIGLGAGLAGHGLYSMLNKEKTAEEGKKDKEEVSYGERAKRAVPYLLGMGTGSVASMVLKNQLKNVRNPAVIKGIQYGTPFVTALAMGSLYPKLKKQFEEDVYQGKK